MNFKADMCLQNDKDMEYMRLAVDCSRRCPASQTAYSVGAVVVTPSGRVFTGHSRETDPHNHAEEEAIMKAVAAGEELRGAVIYSSMEPCTHRKSKPESCTALIIRHGFSRVAYALPEPPYLAVCHGRDILTDAGVAVERITGFDGEVEDTNRHLMR